MSATAAHRHPEPAVAAPVVLVGPWEREQQSRSEASRVAVISRVTSSSDPLVPPSGLPDLAAVAAAPVISATPTSVHPRPVHAAPSSLPSSSQGLHWWGNLFVGLALRVGEALLRVVAPFALLWRYRRAATQTVLRVCAPGATAFLVQGFLATSGAASMPPWSSPAAAGVFAALYVASAIGLVLVVASGRRAARGIRRWLDELARYGAQSRSSG